MIYWASPSAEAGHVSTGDPLRWDARSRKRRVLEREEVSPARQHPSASVEPPPIPTQSPEQNRRTPLTLGGLVGFGILAWVLGLILAVGDSAGQSAQATAIGLLLVMGCLALLAGLAVALSRARLVIRHVHEEHEIRDPLTGLPDERYLLLRLEEEMARARRNQRPLTLALLEVNSLAAVNEQYGRDSGDDVIRHVAAVVQGTKRASDVLVRLGGDKFAIVLAECAIEGGEAFVGRLTDCLARQPANTLLKGRPSHVWVGVCVGLTSMELDEGTPAGILDRARSDLAIAQNERDRRRQQWRTA